LVYLSNLCIEYFLSREREEEEEDEENREKKIRGQVAHIILAICWLIILVIVGLIVDLDTSFGLCGIV